MQKKNVGASLGPRTKAQRHFNASKKGNGAWGRPRRRVSGQSSPKENAEAKNTLQGKETERVGLNNGEIENGEARHCPNLAAERGRKKKIEDCRTSTEERGSSSPINRLDKKKKSKPTTNQKTNPR